MKNILQVLTILFSNLLFAQNIDQKAEFILKTNGTIDGYKSLLIDMRIEPLKFNAELKDSLKLIEIEKELTDIEITSRLIKGFRATFNESEIDEIYKFYSSEAGKKLFNSYETLEKNFNNNFQEVNNELQRIAKKQNTNNQSENTIEIPVATTREDGLYSVKNYVGSTLNLIELELSDQPEIQKSEILEAKISKDELDRNSINLKLTKEGAKKFKLLTKNNIGKPIAIILNKKILSAPMIQSEIPNGNLQISGNFTDEFMQEIVKAFHTK